MCTRQHYGNIYIRRIPLQENIASLPIEQMVPAFDEEPRETELPEAGSVQSFQIEYPSLPHPLVSWISLKSNHYPDIASKSVCQMHRVREEIKKHRGQLVRKRSERLQASIIACDKRLLSINVQ